MLRAKVEQKLGEMIRRNPTRADLLEKFQSMIAEYNAGSASVEQLFEQLLDFIRSISEEEQRPEERNQKSGRGHRVDPGRGRRMGLFSARAGPLSSPRRSAPPGRGPTS